MLFLLLACNTPRSAGQDILDAACSRRDECLAEFDTTGSTTEQCYASNAEYYGPDWCEHPDYSAIAECVDTMMSATCEELLYGGIGADCGKDVTCPDGED